MTTTVILYAKKLKKELKATHHTILSYQGIIRGTKINKPIPFAAPRKHGNCMESCSEHSGASISDQIWFADDINIIHHSENRFICHKLSNLFLLFLWGFSVHVNKIVVSRMVKSKQGSLQLDCVTFWCWKQVCKCYWIWGVVVGF